MQGYVSHLQSELAAAGATAEVNILRSDAGLMTTTEAARNPIYGVLSGPSGGVAGALFVATKAGYGDILTFDMGGTSTDVSLCRDGEPTIGRETTVGQFKRGHIDLLKLENTPPAQPGAQPSTSQPGSQP